MSRNNTARLILRIGLAFAFAYAAIAGFLNPAAWIGFAPVWLQQIVSDSVLTIGIGVVEIAIAALLLFLKRPFYPAIAAAVMLAGIVVFNLGALDIVFRDISLFAAAIALAILSKK